MRNVDWSDVKFARYLAKHGALDNFQHDGNVTYWRNADGDVVGEIAYLGGLVTQTFVKE